MISIVSRSKVDRTEVENRTVNRTSIGVLDSYLIDEYLLPFLPQPPSLTTSLLSLFFLCDPSAPAITLEHGSVRFPFKTSSLLVFAKVLKTSHKLNSCKTLGAASQKSALPDVWTIILHARTI